ncbi:exported hypothetical protein [Candidatus Sulfopaludibacter sp. SbA4]|nr:exported hypothetical protein [Candidatus Sulfopaludibacter sp. SbA4]
MKLAALAAVACLVIPSPAIADAVTYYVLNENGPIIRIPSDGSATATISDPYGGDGFALDNLGNFIAAAVSALVQVSPSGNAVVIANAPGNSQFIDVAIDGSGNYIVADNAQHQVVRISAATHAITPVAFYPASPNELEDSYVRVDGSGNYIVAEDNGSQLHVFRITPGGTVTTIPLSGTIPTRVGGMTFDASGNYVITDYNLGAIDVITPSGAITTLFQNDTLAAAELTGIVRDPGTGDFIVVGRVSKSLYSVAPDGSGFVQFFSGSPLNAPEDIVAAGATGSTPAPTLVNPASGSGSTATFTFTWSDTGGWENLSVVNVLINNVLDGRKACYVAFAPSGPASGTVYLVDDAGDSGGPFSTLALPGSGTAQNGQCSIAGSLSSAQGSGTGLTLMLNITFAAGFAGNQVIYMAAREPVANSGWQALGTWNVPGPAAAGPSVSGLSPGRSTLAAQTYTITYTDTFGWQDIAVANVLVNSAIDGRVACYVAYVPAGAATGTIDLVDNAGDAGGPFSAAVLPGSGTVSNSQCTISATRISATASGNTLVLTLAITFNQSFAGNQVIYAAVRSNTLNSGWQAVGSVTVP